MIVEIFVFVLFGELLDKILILQIKFECISDEGKLVNVCRELLVLEQIWMVYLVVVKDVVRLCVELKVVNE